MQANSTYPVFNGRLDENLFNLHHFREKLIEFIVTCLPHWRDDPQRSVKTAEDSLTQTLCRYLNTATRNTPGYNLVKFEREVEDEFHPKRKVDLGVMPDKNIITVEGKSFTKYETILQIECKRLPTPRKKNRDQREYIFSEYSSTGGIQRFKEGYHGANHNFVTMIGYIQDKTCADWVTQIKKWIDGLIKEKQEGWSAKDHLRKAHCDNVNRTMMLESKHKRKSKLSEIEIRHLWIEMDR